MPTAIANGYDDGDWKVGFLQTIAEETGPLDALAGKNVLVLADVENLHYGAKNFGLSVQFDELARVFRQHSGRSALHAFFSCKREDKQQAKRCQSVGWVPHRNEIKTVRQKGELVTLANSDKVILFSAGYLTHRGDIDVVVIGTGDGELGCYLAEAVVCRRRSVSVLTLSVAESTSYLLNAQINPYVDANIELGLDCLSNVRPSRRVGWFPPPTS